MSLITLTTDFGLKDPDLGQLKSQLAQTLPHITLVDIAHNITPFDSEEAIYIIQNSLSNFPEGTMHFIGIESENNPQNSPVLSIANGQYFFSNNAGLIAAAFEKWQPLHYSIPAQISGRFMQPHIKAAKRLLNGEKADTIGNLLTEVRFQGISKPLTKTKTNTNKISLIVPKVIYNDHYGNAIFNLQKNDFEIWQNHRKFEIKIGHYTLHNIVANYHNPSTQQDQLLMDGQIFARFNDFGYLEIFMYKSNLLTGGANTLLGLKKNQTILISFIDE